MYFPVSSATLLYMLNQAGAWISKCYCCGHVSVGIINKYENNLLLANKIETLVKQFYLVHLTTVCHKIRTLKADILIYNSWKSLE